MADTCLKKGIDVPVYVTYYKKKENQYVIDAPVKYSEIVKKYKTKEEITNALCSRCNEIGKMQFEKEENLKEESKKIAENKKE